MKVFFQLLIYFSRYYFHFCFFIVVQAGAGLLSAGPIFCRRCWTRPSPFSVCTNSVVLPRPLSLLPLTPTTMLPSRKMFLPPPTSPPISTTLRLLPNSTPPPSPPIPPQPALPSCLLPGPVFLQFHHGLAVLALYRHWSQYPFLAPPQLMMILRPTV